MTVGLKYQKDCQLLRAAAELLQLPQPVVATSLAFLHRFHYACPEGTTAIEVAPACLFLASKVEEAQVRINDLLNAFLHLQQPGNRATVAAIFPSLATLSGGSVAPSTANPSGEQAAGAPAFVPGRQRALTVPSANSTSVAGPAAASQESSPALGAPQRIDHPAGQLPAELLVGDAYYAAKDQLIHHEQVLLRWLGFELCVDHPYRYLLNFANVMHCSRPVVRLAMSLVNDSLLQTSMSARRHPADVAAGALQLGASLLSVQLHSGSAGGGAGAGSTDHEIDWRRLVGLEPREVDAAGVELLEVLSNAVAGSACNAATAHNADAAQPT